MIREFIAFVYGLIIRLMPHRLIPRLKSSSWKLAVRRPPAISSDNGGFVPAYSGFDQWIANTREDMGMLLTAEPGMTVIRSRV